MAGSKETRTTCPYCGVGCGVIVTQSPADGVTVKGDPMHPANLGRLCSKGSALADTIGHEGRLLYPQVNGKRTTWDTALTHVSEGLKNVIEQYGPDAVAIYASGQLLTEDYYVANKLMKGFIGSANIDTNSRLCMASPVVSYKRAFGADAVPCNYLDLEDADLIVLEGSNTAWCHPVLFQRIAKQKQQRPNLKIVVIDPRKTATCDIADLHLAIQSGSDMTLFNGLLTYLTEHEHLDQDFIEHHSDGFTDALAAAKVADIHYVAQQCGLAESDITRFYQLFAETAKTVTLYSQGVNQSSSGTDNSSAIINCHLATGRIGRSGMGPFSITGQPNAMGGREVGGLSNQLAAHMEIENPDHHDLVSRFWQTERLATQAGLKAVDLFQNIADGKIKAVWIMATNPVVSMPDADKIKAALAQCELVIVSDCEASTDTMAFADICLPAQTWGEKDGTVTNSERRISHQRRFLPVAGEAKPDWWIVCQVARRLGFENAFSYQTQADIFREHAALSGFENEGGRDFDLTALSTITDEQYQQLEPIQWPVNEEAESGTERLFSDKRFFTANGKAQFISVETALPFNKTSDNYPLILNTGRIRDQWHTMTRTARSAKLTAHIIEPLLEIHPTDAKDWQLQDGGLAKVSSEWGEMLARVNYEPEQKKGSVFVAIHWNQQYASLGRVGSLVNPVVDPHSGQPEFKHTPVKVEAYQAAWYGFLLSRRQLLIEDATYWVKMKGQHFWRYELADDSVITNPESWARQHFGTEGEWLEFTDTSLGAYRAAVLKEGRLAHSIFIAREHTLPARSWLSQLFAHDMIDDETRKCLLAGQAGAGMPDVGPMVCACFGVGKNSIIETIDNEQLSTVEQLGDCLKAGTNCGSCIPELKTLLASHH